MTEAIRKTAPDSLDSVPFDIPGVFQTTFSNGLRIVLLPEKRLPLVSFRLVFFSGDANDPASEVGVTSATMAMLTEGTVNYSSLELAEKIERLGASLSASSSDDFSVIAASALSIYGSEMLDLIAEIIFRPTFPEGELDLYRRNTIENLKFQRSQPNFLANEQTARILFGGHPYSRLSPKPDEVEGLSREMLVNFHKRLLCPNNAVFFAVGDVEPELFLAEVTNHFGDWPAGQVEKTEFPEPPIRKDRTLTVVDRPGSAQANIVLANLAIPRNHPDYFPLIVMNQVLGAGASSRIFMNLREDKGYTYGAYTRFDTKRFAGDFEASAEVRTPVTGDSLREFFYELNRIRDDVVFEEELADAKHFLIGVFPIRAETQEGMTNLIVNQQLYDLPDDYLQTYREKVDAVTAEDVRRVANLYITPEKITMVIVGDAVEILSQAAEFADNVEVFDSIGNLKNIADYEPVTNEKLADFSGDWELKLDFQGQEVSVKLLIVQDKTAVSGKLQTIIGDGEITDGSVIGSKISATAITEIQGQSVEFFISGVMDGDSISGTIATPIIPDSLLFTGRRLDQTDVAN